MWFSPFQMFKKLSFKTKNLSSQLFLGFLLVGIFFGGCGTLETPFSDQDGNIKRSDISFYSGGYKIDYEPSKFLYDIDEGIGFACSPKKRSNDSSAVIAKFKLHENGQHLMLSIFEENRLITKKSYKGKINKKGFFETNTLIKACTGTPVIYLLGWGVARKKSFIGVDEEGILLLGSSRSSLAMMLLIFPFTEYSATKINKFEPASN